MSGSGAPAAKRSAFGAETSMIAYRLGDAFVSVRAPKASRADIGELVGASIPAAQCHLFDTASGERIAPDA